MDVTTLLVMQWADFHANHPNANIEDFCRYHLIHNSEKFNKEEFLGGIVPSLATGMLVKLLNRIIKLYQDYAVSAFSESGITSFEEFVFLNFIGSSNEPRKTEVVYKNFNELSSGLLVIGRLKSKGYVSERNDDEDKRAKRVKLTKKGENVLKICRRQLLLLNEIFFQGIPDDDIHLCTQLLTPIELKFSALRQQHKNIPFEDIYKQMSGSN